MSEITAQMVKELREKTGAGMMDCKKALAETNGDIEKAIEYLRTKGLAAAAKKADRATSEGLVALTVHDNNHKAVIIEINCETDFVAKNDQFIQLVNNVLETQKQNHCANKEELLTKNVNGKTVEDVIKEGVATLGENMQVNRARSLSVQEGLIASYIHNKASDNSGKIGVLVALNSAASQDKLAEIGRQIAMHIAAAKPKSINVAELDQSLVEKEKEIFKTQAKESGKPDSIIEKMVEGRVRKFYEEVVLLEQAFIMDPKITIKEFIASHEKTLGTKLEISAFVRFELGTE